MISANGKVIFVEDERINTPFIYRGSLNDVELRGWLRSVERALEQKSSSTNFVEELSMQLENAKIKEAERNEFISASVYPRDRDPIQSPDNLNIGKQNALSHSHEN